MVEVAQGWTGARSAASSYRKNGIDSSQPRPRAILTNEELDKLPFVTEVYEKNLDYLKYNSPYCQYPYVSMYTGRGCPARCTFCLWPQVTQGHTLPRAQSRKRLRRSGRDEGKFPKMKELFFDDDTFTADAARARKIAQLLKPLGITWSTNSRANVDYETLKVLKDGGLRLFVVGYESGNDADPEEHQEGCAAGPRAALYSRLPRNRDPDPWHLHSGSARRDQRDHPGIDALRARDGLRDHPGVARLALSRHRALRLRRSRMATWPSIRCSTNPAIRSAR